MLFIKQFQRVKVGILITKKIWWNIIRLCFRVTYYLRMYYTIINCTIKYQFLRDFFKFPLLPSRAGNIYYTCNIGLLNWYWWILARVGCKNARACEFILRPTSANNYQCKLLLLSYPDDNIPTSAALSV